MQIFKKLYFFIFTFFIVLSCYAKNITCDFCGMEQLWGEYVRGENSEYPGDSIVEKTELLKNFLKYDFSSLWMKDQGSRLGYVGDNYQRFQIHFNKIQKSKASSSVYLVSGKTKIKNIINSFEGEITLLHVYGMNNNLKNERLTEYKKYKPKMKENPTIETDLRYKENRLFLIAKYSFKELDGNVVSGTACLSFYLENNKIFYDDLDLGTDAYSNNFFTGTRLDAKTGKKEKCNFGNFRIPYSGDLDLGAGDFYPNEKYHKNGWENYVEALGTYYKNPSEKAKKARAEENREWWK